jgi:hypothetical protein
VIVQVDSHLPEWDSAALPPGMYRVDLRGTDATGASLLPPDRPVTIAIQPTSAVLIPGSLESGFRRPSAPPAE